MRSGKLRCWRREVITPESPTESMTRGELIVELPDGSIREINSGEVSVRGIYGMYDAKQLYDRLKVSEREDGILDLDARLRAMNGPLLAWYEEHARILPWRENPEGYRVWISEIMLQQTRVEAVKTLF